MIKEPDLFVTMLGIDSGASLYMLGKRFSIRSLLLTFIFLVM